MPAPVQLTEVRKVYGTGPGAVTALDGVSHAFEEGTFTAVMGPSGSGKSTLLHCAAGLDEPSAGEVTLAGTTLRGLTETALTELRREQVAFVFQAFNLMPALTVRQNVVLPLTLATALEVLSLLRDQSRAAGQTIVMVTHDPVAASYADRVVFLVDGRIVAESPSPTAEGVAAELARLSRTRSRSRSRLEVES
jgi:ABC-type lipoprotein export system ATPase subunit